MYAQQKSSGTVFRARTIVLHCGFVLGFLLDAARRVAEGCAAPEAMANMRACFSSICFMAEGRTPMNDKIKRIYVPMTETGFYILFCLKEPQHGYGISQQVKQMTGGALSIGAGTMYGTLSKMEKDGLIVFEREEEKRKLYRITELGKEILSLEVNRIERLYKNSKGVEIHE